MIQRDVYIVGMARTPVGSFMGALSTVSAPKLGSVAIKGALERAGVRPDQVCETILGCVLPAGVGQAPARQASIGAGIPESTPALTINKVCGSGMKAVMLGVQAILTGDSDVVVAGGMENMSQSPHLLKGARIGFKMGHQELIDSMVFDGLWDPYNDQHMGNCAELCAKERNFSRQEQDRYAIESFRRAQATQKSGKFAAEIVGVEIKGRKGEVTTVEDDEGPSKVQFDKIPQLRPAFQKDGTVTAANASSINDGAAVLILASGDKVKELGLKPIGKIVSTAHHAQAPEWFTTAPVDAMKKAAERANWSMDSIDRFEVNEAFAVVALAAQKELNLPSDRLNARGGAIALGHPIGASGARILVTLLAELQSSETRKGMASICIGGGEATAICIERMS